jgi:hypothetical protein
VVVAAIAGSFRVAAATAGSFRVVVAETAGSFRVAAATAGSFRVAEVTAGSFRVVAAATAGFLRVAAAWGWTILGRMIGEVAPMLHLTVGRPPQTDLVLRPCHKPTGAIPKDHNVVLFCARRLMGGRMSRYSGTTIANLTFIKSSAMFLWFIVRPGMAVPLATSINLRGCHPC